MAAIRRRRWTGRAAVLLTVASALAVVAGQEAGGRISTSCDDDEEAIAVLYTDPGLKVRASAAYKDAGGAGDRMSVAYKGSLDGDPRNGSILCTNNDDHWGSLEITLGNRGDEARLDGKKPAGPDATTTQRIPAFVNVQITGNRGADVLRGHNGLDLMYGNAGADVIDVEDGEGLDVVICGGGMDTARVNGGDDTSGCEKVD